MNIHQPIMISVSFPDEESALETAKQLIEKKLIACAQLTKIHSMYRWQNQLESSQEISMQAKSIQSNFKLVQEFVREAHPYEVPEIIATPILEIDQRYFKWMLEELGLSDQQRYV
jgi:periplasmic divalent cation tolerance protein